jgi:hypothetical protein
MITADLVDRILSQLAQVRARCPELRIGQLIAIIGELAQDETGHSLWEVEDRDFAAALNRFGADIARRESDRAEPGAVAPSPESTAPEPPRQVT